MTTFGNTHELLRCPISTPPKWSTTRRVKKRAEVHEGCWKTSLPTRSRAEHHRRYAVCNELRATFRRRSINQCHYCRRCGTATLRHRRRLSFSEKKMRRGGLRAATDAIFARYAFKSPTTNLCATCFLWTLFR